MCVTTHVMATHFRNTATIQFIADACASIAAALDSDPQTKSLAGLWDALTNKADSLVNARRTAERTLGRVRAKLAVLDVIWDPEIAAFGRDVVDQSGGKRDQAPYLRFFKTTTPSAAQDFGIDREVKQGNDWLAELARHPNEDLATKWIPRLTNVTNDLAAGAQNRRSALQTMALQSTAEELFLDDLNREIDILEGELQKLFPGRPKRVASYLEATRITIKRAHSSEAENPSETG